ncbi:hypothetical protein [Mesorhizobium sp. LNJC394B00]|uniref:hypothetical protein n=1 Tax=Mesorhizobium sp. LNJC394B00 TaxID=1287274 RepID=UPI0003CF5C11|nr:hypothetical protein [Mesorhizobium sp. LNJC394B00]ESY20706.1 hypothetical protein X750_18460 [Mesorhizobium sp. LNJC394B00]
MDHLRAGIANIISGAEQQRRDELMDALRAAAGAYAIDREKSANMALAAVSDFLHDEQLEAPFRFLVDILDERRKKGRRAKPLQRAVDEALTVAAVDALVAEKHISLEQACRDVAKATGGRMKLGDGELQPWEQLKNLRDNIRHRKASPEATEVYEYHCRGGWQAQPYGPPAPLTLDCVTEIWAKHLEDKSCK